MGEANREHYDWAEYYLVQSELTLAVVEKGWVFA